MISYTDKRNISDSTQESGCSPFFLTSAISSIVFGELGRKHQKELVDENIEFSERMQKMKDDFADEKLDSQIIFRRESYELGRQYQIIQTQILNENRKKEVEFDYFCKNCWPLNISPYAIMEEQKTLSLNRGIIPMKVLLAKTEVSAYSISPGECYDNYCTRLCNLFVNISNLDIIKRPWKNKCQSTIAESMNINYIMQGIPTLILYPIAINGSFHLEFAAWSFNKGLGSMMVNKALTFPYSLTNPEDEKVISAMRAVAGSIRDIYMVLEYHRPTVFLRTIDDYMLKIPEIKKFLYSQYNELIQDFSASEDLRNLCSDNEIKEIESSLSMDKKLLDE